MVARPRLELGLPASEAGVIGQATLPGCTAVNAVKFDLLHPCCGRAGGNDNLNHFANTSVNCLQFGTSRSAGTVTPENV